MTDRSNRKFWERIAKIYTPLIERGNRQLFDDLAETLRPRLNKKQTVLELACGTGQLTFRLSEAVGSWLATDFSPAMVQEAKKRSKLSKLIFEVQDATKLSYQDDSFDVVVAANMLHIMPEPERALAEIQRVLKPNGLLIAPTFVHEGKMKRWLLAIFEAVGFRTFHKWTSAEFSEFIKKNDFEIIDCQVLRSGKMPECLLVAKKERKRGKK